MVTPDDYPPDVYLGEIRMVAFNYAPDGWTSCDGRELAISDNTPLFELLGTTYGGDGEGTFGVPDLRGRVPLGIGLGDDGSHYFPLGERGGSATALQDAQGSQSPFVALNFILSLYGTPPSQPLSQGDPLLGEVRMTAGAGVPPGWAPCEGQVLPLSQNTALFSVLGTTYGGDGKSTFALPDLRGAMPMCSGEGPGPSPQPDSVGERIAAGDPQDNDLRGYAVLAFCIAMEGTYPAR